MNLDVDFLINFFEKYSGKNYAGEIGEQDSAPSSSTPSSGGGGGGNVPKWEDSYQTKRGKANPLMKSGEKWTTGITRGTANQIW
jgi:hypothetical protein